MFKFIYASVNSVQANFNKNYIRISFDVPINEGNISLANELSRLTLPDAPSVHVTLTDILMSLPFNREDAE